MLNKGDKGKLKGGFCIFFCVLHTMQIIMIFMLLKDYHFVDPDLVDLIVKHNSKDTFHVAMQIGRFDLLTTLLAIISILIALAAVFGFLEVRTKALRIANDVAKDEAIKVAKKISEDVATKAVVDVITRLAPSYIHQSSLDTSDYGKAAGGENGNAEN